MTAMESAPAPYPKVEMAKIRIVKPRERLVHPGYGVMQRMKAEWDIAYYWNREDSVDCHRACGDMLGRYIARGGTFAPDCPVGVTPAEREAYLTYLWSNWRWRYTNPSWAPTGRPKTGWMALGKDVQKLTEPPPQVRKRVAPQMKPKATR